MKLTKNECRAIEGIVSSEYGEGAINRCVWSWSANPFASKKSFAGVIASLSKKGAVSVSDEGKDANINLNEAGWLAYKAAPAEFRNPEVNIAELDRIDALLAK
jgi:hypothetical protein